MQEMIQGIDFVKKTFEKVCASPCYSIVLDESTNLSTVKQTGGCCAL